MTNPVGAALRFAKNQILYGTLLRPYAISRHQALLRNADRSQSHTYTCFRRSPGQLEALCGPVLDVLLGGRAEGKLAINVFAGSTGAEVYTIASLLLRSHPRVDFRIAASDLHQETVDRAVNAVYSEQEVKSGGADPAFVAGTFERTGAAYRVRPELRARVSFRSASLLDPAALAAHHGPADLVFAQNVFFHLNRDLARQAFRNVLPFLNARSAIFIDGMELDMREELTAEAGLSPLDFKCREIHERARIHVRDRWWNCYYGMEPYAGWHPNRLRRYSTIFFKGMTQVGLSPTEAGRLPAWASSCSTTDRTEGQS